MNSTMQPDEDPEAGHAGESEKTLKILHAKELFGESREIVIENEGEHYRLRITRRGKLILQK